MILLLLGGCRGVHTCVFDVGPHWCSTVRTYGGSTVCMYGYRLTNLQIQAFSFFVTGALTYMYIRTYGRSTFTFYEMYHTKACSGTSQTPPFATPPQCGSKPVSS